MAKIDARTGARTQGLKVKSLTLYRLSYSGCRLVNEIVIIYCLLAHLLPQHAMSDYLLRTTTHTAVIKERIDI